METFNFDGYLKRGSADFAGALYAFELPRSPMGAMAFHLSIWLSGVDVTQFKLVNDLEQTRVGDKAQGAILFSKQEDYDAFLIWWERYNRSFICRGPDVEFLPRPPEDQKLTVYSMGLPLRMDIVNNHRDGVTMDLFNSWSWIAHNATGKVWRIPGCYLFEKEDDAVLFKLSYES
jgi:hypothetical protein